MTDTARVAGRYGLRPVRQPERALRLADYLHPDLPPPPPSVDWTVAMPDQAWGMLGNDQVGDCFWAGQAHAGMLWSSNASGTPTEYTDAQVLGDYSAACGYRPDDPDSDVGTDPLAGLTWIRKHGLAGRPLIDAFVMIDETDDDELKRAIDIFGLVGVGIEVPSSAEDQFAAGEPWHVVPGDRIVGAHWIILGAYDRTHLRAVTWGAEQLVEWDFWRRQQQCAFAMFGPDWVTPRGTTPSGLNLAQLGEDIRAFPR